MSNVNVNENSKNSMEEVLSLAQKNGLHLAWESAKLEESGMDFQVVFVDDQEQVVWVLRKPRRSDVLERAELEEKVLKLVEKHLPVAVPDWRIFTPELIAYPKLSGVPVATVDLVAKNYVWNLDHESLSSCFIQSLAKVMVSLHQMNHEEARKAGIPVLNPSEVRQTLLKNMEKVKQELGVSPLLWERWQKWVSDDSYWPGHSSFIHGDLHSPHILIDSNERVTGILDWTEAKVTDPAIDFTLFAYIFGDLALDRLLDAYQREGGRVWPRMRDHILERLAAYPIEIATFALLTKDEEMLKMARASLGLEDSN